MATIIKTFTFSAGGTIIASEHNSNFDTIYADYNGNITNVNISANAAIADTKLAQITTAQKVNLTALVVTSQAQGDTIYASDATTFVRLPKNTNATRYWANTGTDNNPAWDQVNFVTGGTGNLALKHFAGGTNASNTTFWRGDRAWVEPLTNQFFSASGTFVAPTGISRVFLTMVGGGGGGGGGGGSPSTYGGGGAGGAAVLNYVYAVTGGNSYTVTVGAAGAAGAAAGNGGAGGASSFDSTISVAGGNGGLASGAGGTAPVIGYAGTQNTAGGYTISGGKGGTGNGTATISGGGGGSAFGAGAAGVTSSINGVAAAANSGGGGSGGGDTGQTGGAGGSGFVLVAY